LTTGALGFDPYAHDPQQWGVSLAHMGELMIPCLDAAGVRTIAELGAYAGDLTRVIVAWAAGAGARVQAIDPSPQLGLVELDAASPALELIRRTSLEALSGSELPDAIVIDGDHNYYTGNGELAAIAARAAGAPLPLLLFHDVCWPHARRDDYFDASLIPEEARHPVAGGAGGLYPGDPGLRPGALPYPRSAAHEGGPGNGVLTAVEDFVAGQDDLRLVVVPAFFGFGVVWSRSAPWAEQVEAILAPWDRHPILERLEANRVHHIAEGHVRMTELWKAKQRQAELEAVLQRMLRSSAFTVAERLSALRMRAGVASDDGGVSKAEIRRVLGEP
jgi:hypothetical protein